MHLNINIYRLYEQEIDVFGSTRDGAAFGKRSEKGVYHRGFVQGEGRIFGEPFASDRFRLAIYDRAAKKSTVLTEKFDNWVDDYKWAPDSKSIFFLGQVQGTQPLYKLDIARKTISPVLTGKAISEFDFDNKGMLYYTYSTTGKPSEDVMKVTDKLATLEYVDSTRMGAMGWSYGGYMMNWLQGHTKRFKCLASMMGVYDLRSMWGSTEEVWFPNFELEGQPYNSDLYEKWSPSSYIKNFSTPTLVMTGELDYRVPYTQSLQYFTALQTLNIPSRLIVLKYDGHWPSNLKSMPLYYNAHLDWFHRYLGGAPAPWDTEKMVNNEIEY